MNHSCNPNCATQKWIVRGRLRIGLFALKKIKAYTELTFDYKFIRFGAAAQKCLCGDSNCKGVIGEEQKDTRLISVKKPTSQQEEDDALLALERFKGDRGVEDADDLALLARLFLRMEDLDSIKLLLKTLSLTKDQSLLKRFVTLHGLQIINILIGIYWRDLDLVSEAVLILSSLPVQNRNAIEDANIEDRINRIGARDDLPPDIIERSRKLLENWSTLEHVYRIPKIVPDQKGSQAVPTSAIGGYSLLDGGDRFKRAKWSTAGLSASRSDQGQRHEYWRSPSSPAKESPTAWRKARAPDGRIYYYHEVTRETRWELPHEDKNGDQHWRDHNPRTNRPGDNRKIKDRDRRHDDQKLTPQDRIREPETIPHQARLHEIIERAKNAALTRNSSSEKSSTDADRSIKAKSSNPKDHGSQEWRSFEDLLRDAVSHVVVKYLSRWCRNQNLPPETFKDMARKLTHGIVDKELRHLRREMASPPTALTEDGLLSKSKRAKIKSYLSQYLRDHGYRVDDDSPAISGTTSSVSSLRDQ